MLTIASGSCIICLLVLCKQYNYGRLIVINKCIKTLFFSLLLCALLSISALANNTKLIALTFDDGPSATHTPPLLDELAKRNVKVSFFLVGNRVEKFPEIVKRAFDEGHQLGNHTYSHPFLTKLNNSAIKKEISSTSALISDITGQGSFFVRPPYGSLNRSAKQTIGQPLIIWSVDPCNGRMNVNEYVMKQNLVSAARDGSIIILHDTSRKDVSVALYAIDELLNQGYEFVTLNELFRLRGVTPVAGETYYCVPADSDETYFDEAHLDNHWASDYISFVSDRGIMQGDGQLFEPNAYLTRAMAVTIIWRMAACPSEISSPAVLEDASFKSVPGIVSIKQSSAQKASNDDLSGIPAQVFDDVPTDLWFSEAVAWGFNKGCIDGVSEGLFDPYSYVTKEQFYTMLYRFGETAIDKLPSISAPASYRDDVRISSWAGNAVRAIREAGFSSENDPEIFRPLDNMTRGEAAELVTWYFNNFKAPGTGK